MVLRKTKRLSATKLTSSPPSTITPPRADPSVEPPSADAARFESALSAFTSEGTLSIGLLKEILTRPTAGSSAPLSIEEADALVREMLDEGVDLLAGERLLAGECASTWADAAKGPTPLNALMESIGEGIATQVVAALEAGADPNGVDDVELRWTASAASAAALPLVRVGYSQGEAAAAHSVKALLGAGPTTCNRATHDALTPALWCVLLGRTSLLATLQAGGADLDLALPQAGSRTPLYQASDLLRMHMDAP